MASKSASRVLTDHDEIRRWAEERGAKPAAVRRTERDEDVGIIRLDFHGYGGESSLDEISWNEWFDKLDDKNLALLVQDHRVKGKSSNFNKLLTRDTIEERRQEGCRGSGRSTAARSSGSRELHRRKRAPRKTQQSSRKSSRSERSTARGSAKKKSAGTLRSSRKRSAA